MILLTGGWCLLPEGSAPGEGVSAPGGGCLLLGGLVWPGGSGLEGSGLGVMSAPGGRVYAPGRGGLVEAVRILLECILVLNFNCEKAMRN